MTTLRKTLTACLAELEPGQVLDVMGYIKSRPRYLQRLKHWACLLPQGQRELFVGRAA